MVNFLDEKGDPIQKGFYRDELNGKGRIVFYTGQNKDGQALCCSRGGPISVAPEHTRYFKKIQDLKKYREETSEDLDWAAEVSNRLENKTLDLDFSDSIFMGPDVYTPPKQGFPGPVDGPTRSRKNTGIDSAIQGPSTPNI